jgi:putative Mg2+ transporter-C (MgtC) family protein
VAAQIVTGIGFLGAGTILRMGVEIRGLTTAASIWAVAAIGMAVSVGGPFLIVAVAATALTLLTLTVMDNVERFFVPMGHPRMCELELDSPETLNDVLEELEKTGAKHGSLRVISGNPYVVQVAIRGKQKVVSSALAGVEGVRRVDWMEPGG